MPDTLGNGVQFQVNWFPFAYESGWCGLQALSNWTTETLIIVHEASSKMDLSSDSVVVVRVRFPDGNLSELRRFFLDAPPARNALRILSNVLIPIMVLAPLVILFGGYHNKFGKKFLVFQYVALNDDQQPNDVIMRKAMIHSLILIAIQAVLQIIVVIVAFSVEHYLSLHLPIAVFAIPILLLGAIACVRKEPLYLLGYIVLEVWFVSMQVSAMLILVNMGTDAIADSAGSFHRSMIVTQILIALDVVVVVVSLSPLTFLYVKSAPSRFVKAYVSAHIFGYF